MSAILPKGTRHMAVAKRYDVTIQLSRIAFASNSLPMDGSAMLIDDDMKVIRKEAWVVIARATILFVVLYISFGLDLNKCQPARLRVAH